MLLHGAILAALLVGAGGPHPATQVGSHEEESSVEWNVEEEAPAAEVVASSQEDRLPRPARPLDAAPRGRARSSETADAPTPATSGDVPSRDTGWSLSIARTDAPLALDLGAAYAPRPGERPPTPEVYGPAPGPSAARTVPLLPAAEADVTLGATSPAVGSLRMAVADEVRGEGVAVLRLVFDASGRVTQARVVRASGPVNAWSRVAERATRATASPKLAGATVDLRLDVTFRPKPAGQTHATEIHGELWAMASSDDLMDQRDIRATVLRVARPE